FAQWRSQASPDTRLHMVMNIYHDGTTNANAVRLRPFIVMPDAVMLTAMEFLDCTSRVYDTDKKTHPEWFK
ncbi:hypothetical protein ORL99_30960, partial [Klebsiella oxytoca]|uniref:hypothetical protein n=2 Tax=Enterobacterales TaxID=91347 RepID=UPI0022462B41